MTRQQIDIASNHELIFGTTYDLTRPNNTITLDLTTAWGSFGGLVVGDIVLTSVLATRDPVTVTHSLVSETTAVDAWGVHFDDVDKQIVFTAPTNAEFSSQSIPLGSTITVSINGNKLVNPSVAGSHQISMYLVSYDGLGGTGTRIEKGSVDVPIVDSDTVDVTGYISAFMHFDIDTGTGEDPGPTITVNCDSTGAGGCLTYGDAGAGAGPVGANYTVDLGELTSTGVNKSQTSALQADGHQGIINSIYFDLTTNSASGGVVTVSSANEGLQGPGANKITSIGVAVGADGITRSEGGDIPMNSGVYGFTLPVNSYQLAGIVVKNTNCTSNANYCGATTAPKTVFTTGGLPVDKARVRMDLAASANNLNSPGNYTDTLTFVATGTF
jgi:hypothetical protein